jgi:hypothetical protein
MKKYAFLIFILVSQLGCEKDITFNLNNAPDVLVVDGNIEYGRPPEVMLTQSLDFFNTLSADQLANSFVHNAVVTISNGTTTHQLKEYSTTLPGGYKAFRYSIDSSNLATAFLGKINTRYTLHIKSAGKDYEATTFIPSLAKKLDSMWWAATPFPKEVDDVAVMIQVTDPPGLGNYIRYFTKINNEPFLPGRNSVADDQVINDITYRLQLEPGVDRNLPKPKENPSFKKGDVVTLKVCNIDKDAYNFFSTWEFAFNSIGNPFSQPNKVMGNVSNGALGAFYGYGAIYKTLVIPK